MQCEKFNDPKWYLNGVWKGIFGITDAIVSFFNKTIEAIGYLIVKTADGLKGIIEGVADTIGFAGGLVSCLPWLLCGGAVAFAGFEAYKLKTTGKFYGKNDLMKMGL